MDIIKILLVEPSHSIGEAITKSLQRAFGAEVIYFPDSASAVELIRKGENFSIVIARNHNEESPILPHDRIAEQLLNTIYDCSLKTPLIIIGDFEHTLKNYALVSEKFRIEEINRFVVKALGLKQNNYLHLKLPDYVPFAVKHFYLMTKSPCSIFIKLLKKSGDEFVKRLNLDENFNREDLKKYEELGLSDLYILKEDYEVFMNSLFEQTLSNLKTNKILEENVELVADSFVLSTDLMRTLGITPNCLAVVDQTISMMRTQILKADKIGPLLRKLLDDKMSYSYRHSYLISALAYTILPKMEWGSGDQQNILFEKICMVCYFHDVYLEDDKLIQISSLDDMRKAKLTVSEKDTLLNHAHKAAVLIQHYPKLPQGVDLIIKQHHGVANGYGFPESLTAAVSPMAIFFIVLEDFAKHILAINEPPEKLAHTMRAAIIPLKEKYQLPSYRKIVNELEIMMHPKASK